MGVLHNIKHLWGVGQPKIWLSEFCFSTDIATLKVTQDELDEFVRICEVSGIPVAEQCAMFKRVLWQIKNYGDNGFGDRDPGQGSRIIYWFQHLPLSTAPAGTATVEGTASGTGEPTAAEVDGIVLTSPPPTPTTQQSQTSGPQPPSIHPPPTSQTSEPLPPSPQPPPSTVPAAVQGLAAGADDPTASGTDEPPAKRRLVIKSSVGDDFNLDGVPENLPWGAVKQLQKWKDNVHVNVRQRIAFKADVRQIDNKFKKNFTDQTLVGELPDGETILLFSQSSLSKKPMLVDASPDALVLAGQACPSGAAEVFDLIAETHGNSESTAAVSEKTLVETVAIGDKLDEQRERQEGVNKQILDGQAALLAEMKRAPGAWAESTPPAKRPRKNVNPTTVVESSEAREASWLPGIRSKLN